MTNPIKKVVKRMFYELNFLKKEENPTARRELDLDTFIDEYPILPKEEFKKANELSGKTTLVIKSVLAIHESIEDSDALVGYEGKPLQVEKIYWQVWGILARHKILTTSEEVLETWHEECVDAKMLDKGL